MIQKELFIHYSITLKIFSSNFSITFGCQSIHIEHDIPHHIETRKLWTTRKSLLLDKSVESFSKSVQQKCWHAWNCDYYRTNINEIILSRHWSATIGSLRFFDYALCFVEIIKNLQWILYKKLFWKKFLNSQFCSAAESHVWIHSFVLVPHQPPCYKNESRFWRYLATHHLNHDSQKWINRSVNASHMRVL